MRTAACLPDNSYTEIRLRRYRDALTISGAAVIAFSVWDVLKVYIGLFLGEKTLSDYFTDLLPKIRIPEGVPEETMQIVLWVVLLAGVIGVSIFILLYHLYIGLNAMQEGHRTVKKKKIVYLVCDVLSILSSATVLFQSIRVYFVGGEDARQIGLATLLVESASFLNYVYLFYVVLKIRITERSAS
ncbi:MAG: hypothetical protein K6G16_04885 [Lachnospiraceae bacterium]|nr:hypothetical protein [Lachnospiraceae bacterium]